MFTLNKSVIWLGSGIILISLIIALLLPKSNRYYMRGFFFCSFIGFLVSANSISSRFFHLYTKEINFFIQSILHLCDLLFWTLFFKNIFNDKMEFLKIKFLSICTLVIAIYLLYFNNTDSPNLHINAILNVCKTIFCILFYNKLFKNIHHLNILLEPSFWIVSGLFFYSCMSVPFYALNNYVKGNFTPLIYDNILAVSNMLIIIMYLFFIKAYICTIRLHRG